jgi:prolyl-tRNA synthetase
MKVYYTDAKGKKKPVWFASYGIGSTRVMGALVEVSHDDKGIIWRPQVAPFDVHLVDINQKEKAKKIYEKLLKEKVDVLWDDRDIAAGQKFADADLIGIPVRIIVSADTGDKIEWKKRASNKVETITLEQAIKRLK